jgi:hypothetical protein
MNSSGDAFMQCNMTADQPLAKSTSTRLDFRKMVSFMMQILRNISTLYQDPYKLLFADCLA